LPVAVGRDLAVFVADGVGQLGPHVRH
jgi:hypothetical protein